MAERAAWLPGPGVIAGVLLLFGASSFGDTPDTRDTTAQVARYFTTNRTTVLVGCVLVGLGLLAVLAVCARMTSQLDSAGQRSIARFTQGCGSLVVTVMLVTVVLINAGLSYVIGDEVPDMAKGLFELTLVATPIVSLALAGFVGGVALGLHRAGMGRRWFVILSTAMAVGHVVGAASFARSGPFSPDVQQQVYLMSFVVWLLVSGRGVRSRDT